MKDVIDCHNCGGNLVREDELHDLYLCDTCGLSREDGVDTMPDMTFKEQNLMPDMTFKELNIAIARRRGVLPMSDMCRECWGEGVRGLGYGRWACTDCKTTGKTEPYYSGPNYLGDLNAMRLALETLDDGQKACYVEHLCSILGFSEREEWTLHDVFVFSQATSTQQAEALRRTVGGRTVASETEV